jgi:hypothetical protein
LNDGLQFFDPLLEVRPTKNMLMRVTSRGSVAMGLCC